MTRDEIGDMIAALPEGLEPDELIYRLVNWAVDKEREACAKAPPKREWVGLTTVEVVECQEAYYYDTYSKIEAKLREKNA